MYMLHGIGATVSNTTRRKYHGFAVSDVASQVSILSVRQQSSGRWQDFNGGSSGRKASSAFILSRWDQPRYLQVLTEKISATELGVKPDKLEEPLTWSPCRRLTQVSCISLTQSHVVLPLV